MMIEAEKQVHQERCREYLSQRRSTYEFRCKRYLGVIEKLRALGLRDGDRIVDVGAGSQDFHRCLQDAGYRVSYIPIDGSIDGTDLNEWTPPANPVDFYVCIEILEHLHNPFRLMDMLCSAARKGCVATTPNSEVIDTLAIDATHVTSLYEHHFRARGWKTELRSFFCEIDDSILAWSERRQPIQKRDGPILEGSRRIRIS